MLRNILLILIPAIAAALPASVFSSCSKGCNCSETNVAVCNTLKLEPFGVNIFSLKVIHPELPLILKENPFNISGLEKLNSISIENATILEMDESAFVGVPWLNSFTILNSNIQDIGNPSVFQNATSLKALKITNSTLKSFEFIKSKSIEELELSRCELTEITENSFKNLPFLTYINLENNRISKIDRKTFSSLEFLEDVNLSQNGITEVDPNLFENNTELVSLDLSNNPLKKFQLKIESELEKLVLSSCQLDEFGKDLRNSLTLLSYLDLSHNNITFSIDSFAKMEELEYIDLSNNKLVELDAGIFRDNYKLQKVILDNNKFNKLPKFYCNADDSFGIYYFSCQNCSLTSLSFDSFKNFWALVTLNLSYNRLTGKDLIAMRNLRTLIEIDLSYNNLSSIYPLAFTNSTALEKINLSGNRLVSLDANVFINNKALKSIDASFCALKKIWKQADKTLIASLTQLNVAKNSISTITTADLNVVPLLKVLDISENPLNCDDNLKDSVMWLNSKEVAPVFSLPVWKTRESVKLEDANKFEYLSSSLPDWKELAKRKCPVDYYLEHYERKVDKIDDNVFDNYDYYEDYEDEDDEDNASTENDSIDIDGDTDDNDVFDDEENTDVDISELARENGIHSKNSSRYSILWPTLVFIFTALSVLVIAANIMLLFLRTRMVPRHVNLPHIKIPQWNSGGKLKKHSGSVYQPLSEDRSDSFTPIITRKEPTSIIHNYSPPKSTV